MVKGLDAAKGMDPWSQLKKRGSARPQRWHTGLGVARLAAKIFQSCGFIKMGGDVFNTYFFKLLDNENFDVKFFNYEFT